MHTGDYSDAIQDFSHVLGIKPTDVNALSGRGVAYTREGDYDRAIQDFDQALLINPRYGFGFGKRSVAYARKGA
jgi:Flp pilus assembly protein TadD